MRKCLLMLAAVGFLISFSSLSLQANLIINGSFETPVVPVGGFTNFFSGSTAITGWMVVGPEASIVSKTYIAGCCTFPAEDGNQWLDLTGDVSNAIEGVQQTVATSPGTKYTLTFWVGNVDDPTGIFGKTSTVNVLLGGTSGTLLATVTNSSTTTTLTWQQFTETFTATGSTTTLDFMNGDPRSDNSNGLDNVVLNASGTTGVPEPATLPLFVAGLLGLGFFQYRKAIN